MPAAHLLVWDFSSPRTSLHSSCFWDFVPALSLVDLLLWWDTFPSSVLRHGVWRKLCITFPDWNVFNPLSPWWLYRLWVGNHFSSTFWNHCLLSQSFAAVEKSEVILGTSSLDMSFFSFLETLVELDEWSGGHWLPTVESWVGGRGWSSSFPLTLPQLSLSATFRVPWTTFPDVGLPANKNTRPQLNLNFRKAMSHVLV
jgi:hypothetical protein